MTSILKVPYMDHDFLVCIDASNEGLGGVLFKKIGWLPMLQENFNQEKYATHDLQHFTIAHALKLQLFTIAHALKFWRHLVGRKFESWTSTHIYPKHFKC